MPADRANILSDASVDLREIVESLAKRVHHEAGATLFRQGDEGKTFYLVREGEIEISALSPGGRRLAQDVMRKGDLLGKIALFGREPDRDGHHAEAQSPRSGQAGGRARRDQGAARACPPVHRSSL